MTETNFKTANEDCAMHDYTQHLISCRKNDHEIHISPSYVAAMAGYAALHRNINTLKHIKTMVDQFQMHQTDINNYMLMVNSLIQLIEGEQIDVDPNLTAVNIDEINHTLDLDVDEDEEVIFGY